MKSFLFLFFISMILIKLSSTEFIHRIQLHLGSIFSFPQSYAINIFNLFRLQQENKVLQEKLSKALLENNLLKSYKYENEELKELLKIKSSSDYDLLLASVKNKEPNVNFPTRCVIDKGLEEGVTKDAPVLSLSGLYGKVIEVGSHHAVVQTIFDHNFRSACVDLRSGIHGIFRFDNGLVVEQVPLYSDIKKGDEIITSGIGEVFPKGISIGIVKEIVEEKSTGTARIILENNHSLLKVSHLLVLLSKSTKSESKLSEIWSIEERRNFHLIDTLTNSIKTITRKKKKAESIPQIKISLPEIREY